jgi:thiamine pyrophosphokinase
MTPAFRFARGVTLVGGGAADRAAFREATALAPLVVAADGGADALEGWGARPEAVIGDMDSATVADLWRARGVPVLRLPEQDTTDLEKCLYSVDAPFFVGVGFTGRRFDHTLAALHAMLRWRKPMVLLGEEDVIFLCPADWRARLAPGARVSFFPLQPARGLVSEGLVWPIDGLDFAPGVRVGTSNAASAETVAARFDGPGMACVLERRFLPAAVAALGVGSVAGSRRSLDVD